MSKDENEAGDCTHLSEEHPPPEQEPKDNQIVIINNMSPPENTTAPKSVGLIGDITEEKSEEVLSTLIYLKDQITSKTSDPQNETPIPPIDMYVSTYGGSVVDMFAIYDLMRIVKTKCEISTIGLGKVMSAGVLLLASGTKGLRKIGKNCRVMIHGVSCPAQYGSLASVENDIKEVKWIQDRYVECLHLQTDLTKKKILKMLNKQVDTYISAEEAIEYGIADIIV